eukprot:gnl/TRDRNA2_/TRDRNA2_94640_c0_seq1.p1 gnl/TRDRNA2_/TRDRNA2_94640_c0~~gnl/TRDRNA2_/TRDRNA2_94640_c0_seq1.p1  ORF type:complete len:125 (+),score=16.48 gnl/TRDRNA2_/TRDRNA2_94640_c0_seq1:13-387(+)
MAGSNLRDGSQARSSAEPPKLSNPASSAAQEALGADAVRQTGLANPSGAPADGRRGTGQGGPREVRRAAGQIGPEPGGGASEARGARAEQRRPPQERRPDNDLDRTMLPLNNSLRGSGGGMILR